MKKLDKTVAGAKSIDNLVVRVKYAEYCVLFVYD